KFRVRSKFRVKNQQEISRGPIPRIQSENEARINSKPSKIPREEKRRFMNFIFLFIYYFMNLFNIVIKCITNRYKVTVFTNLLIFVLLTSYQQYVKQVCGVINSECVKNSSESANSMLNRNSKCRRNRGR